MITFLDTKSKAVIGVSMKVMYSFFALNGQFKRVEKKPDYFIVRSPFSRAVSTFYDKCHQALITTENTQDCQRVLMRHFGFQYREDLASISFGDFVSALPLVINYDIHFFPQVPPRFRPRRQGVVKMDDGVGLKALGAELKIDFSKKTNSTNHGPCREIYLLFPMARVGICRLYAEDFDWLGYSRIIGI